MSPDLDMELRIWTLRYLSGEISLDTLGHWYSSATWEDDTQLGSEIGLLLSEYSNGDRSEADLRHELGERVGHAAAAGGILSLSHSRSGSVAMGHARVYGVVSGDLLAPQLARDAQGTSANRKPEAV